MQTAITRTSGPGRVLLVDDHPAVRRVLRSLLEEVGGWQVVGEADSGESAVDLVEQLAPDVVLMDCRMPGAGGVAATRKIVQRWPEVAVVAHTAYADETYVREMVAAGARGYVLKGDVPAAVLEALSAARQGQARLSAAVTGPVMEDLRELYEPAVSRSKELEAENADLSSTVARLEEVDRLKDEFLAMVSHELRTPITVVLGMAQTLVGRPDMAATADGQEILQRVVRQGKRLRDMVEQLLQASAFVANRSPVLRAEEVQAVGVIGEVVDDWRLAEPDRRVELRLPSEPRSLRGDAEALRMVVGNLVDNAGKHAPPGTPVQVEVTQPRGLTRIEVTDRGDGVAEIDRERIFAPFTQLDASSGSSARASGCGTARRLHDPPGRRGRPRPVPGRPAGQGHGRQGLGRGQPGRRRPLRGRAARPGPGIGLPLAPGTSRPPEASKRHVPQKTSTTADRPAPGRPPGRRLRRPRQRRRRRPGRHHRAHDRAWYHADDHQAAGRRPDHRHRHGRRGGRGRLPAPGRGRDPLPAGRRRPEPAAERGPGGGDRPGRPRPAQHLPAGRAAGGLRHQAGPLARRAPARGVRRGTALRLPGGAGWFAGLAGIRPR
jgi:signal transduction histidine kinase